MDDATLYANWYIGLGIAVVVVLVAATLLIMVWMAARRIRRLAEAALGLVTEIKENTQSIWHLQETNQVAGSILEGAEEINTHAVMVAEALKEAEKK